MVEKKEKELTITHVKLMGMGVGLLFLFSGMFLMANNLLALLGFVFIAFFSTMPHLFKKELKEWVSIN